MLRNTFVLLEHILSPVIGAKDDLVDPVKKIMKHVEFFNGVEVKLQIS